MSLSPALLGRLRARHLALVVAIDTHRSLRRAAAEIALTQPAATKLLHDLEDALGAPLFERHAWGMSPTPYGETLVRHARGMLNDLAQAQADIAAQRAGALGSLRVGGVTGSVPRFIAPAIGALRAAHPRVRVYALVNTSEVLVDALRRGELDIAVTPRPPDDELSGLETHALADEPLTIVARAGHPFARKRSVAPAALNALTWIVPPAGSPLRRDFDAIHAAAGARPPTDLIETVSIVATLALLQTSDALSLLPEGLARHYEAPGMLARLAVPLPGAGTRYEVMTRASRTLAPAAQAFVEALARLARRQDARVA
ncbi:MAG TPA: LysR substrate-binding domain-containing protein [Casimicrobiaceae bacterium]